MKPVHRSTDRRDEGRVGLGDGPRLSRFAAVSTLLHAVFLMALGLTLAPVQQPVLADPLYEVALVPWKDPNYEPPKPASAPRERLPKATPPPPEPKKETVPNPVQETPKPAPVKRTEPKPAPESTRKPPQPRPETEKPETPPASPVEASTSAPPDRVSLGRVDQRDFQDDYYMALVRRLLAGAWRESGLRDGVNKVTVGFVIHRDGAISELRVLAPSGSSVYDRSALAAVDAVKRFPPLSQSYHGEFISLSVNFEIHAEGRR